MFLEIPRKIDGFLVRVELVSLFPAGIFAGSSLSATADTFGKLLRRENLVIGLETQFCMHLRPQANVRGVT
jgi:hypothetical protein